MNAMAMVALAWICGRALVHHSEQKERQPDMLQNLYVLLLAGTCLLAVVMAITLAGRSI